jgi:glycosyltransferase involved in cell wall biosynthesis
MKLLIAIPALNEESSIANVVKDVHNHIPQANVLVIDDGSTDDTAAIARQAGAKVISLPFNVGVGGALRVAFKFALENQFDQVLQIDADGQHLPSEAKQLIDKVSQDSIVIGSRFLAKNNNYKVGIARKFAMSILAFIASAICKTKLTDVTSGFRITSGKAIKIFSTEYPRDYLGDTVESLIIAHRAGIKISEVPVVMHQRLHGNPSQNLIKSIWYLSRALLVILLTVLRKSSNDKRF